MTYLRVAGLCPPVVRDMERFQLGWSQGWGVEAGHTVVVAGPLVARKKPGGSHA